MSNQSLYLGEPMSLKVIRRDSIEFHTVLLALWQEKQASFVVFFAFSIKSD